MDYTESYFNWLNEVNTGYFDELFENGQDLIHNDGLRFDEAVDCIAQRMANEFPILWHEMMEKTPAGVREFLPKMPEIDFRMAADLLLDVDLTEDDHGYY